MGLVVFRAFAVSSHYNATFKVAAVLQQKYGHEVVYIGDDSFSEIVRSNGFQYLRVNSEYIRVNKLTGNHSLLGNPNELPASNHKMNRVSSFLSKYYWKYKLLILANKRKLSSEEQFKNLFLKLAPALIFIDTFYDYEFPLLYKYKIPFVVYQTKFSTNREKNIPPLLSTFVPQKSYWSNLYCEFLWVKNGIVSNLRRASEALYYLGDDNKSTFEKVIKKYSFPESFLYRKRTFNPGFTNTLEFLLSPLELDFERDKQPFQIFMGPVANMERIDMDYDYAFRSFREEILADCNKDMKIIFCSLGSISDLHYSSCGKFYRRLISIAGDRNDYILVLSIGFNYQVSEFLSGFKNVFVFQKVPQIEILRFCDIMITHGGMQSIVECVLSGVPMIVYPLNARWDQNGNSARVVKHGLGLRGNIRNETSKGILSKIEKTLSNPSFKRNIISLKNKMEESRNFDNGMEILNSFIRQRGI